MKIGILAIDNGLGHLRRQVIIANCLAHKNYEIDLFCNAKNTSKLKLANSINVKNLIIDREKLTGDCSVQKEFSGINFQKYDVFISDNCLEILEFEPRTIIFGSFFWHKSVPVSNTCYERSERILAMYKPIIVANELFAANYILEQPRTKLVGLFTDFKIDNIAKKDKKGILISAGLGGIGEINFKSFSKKIEDIATKYKSKVWVEPSLLNDFTGSCFERATYTEKNV